MRKAINEYYEVDTEGNVYSLRFNRKLSPKNNWDGYLRIQLWDHGKCQYVGIHRLIAEAFIPNPENKPFINHKNGNKQDNRVENLEWCTQQENIVHAWKTGLSKSHMNHPKQSAKVLQFSYDGQTLIKEWPSQMEVERQLGINHVNVSHSCRCNLDVFRKRPSRAGGFVWRFAETCND